ncbi:CCAAT/enhancer-binding protein zeta isoform X2 [Pectinophora gossypiella]|uniref:CCAAT/enhancer-binding protein zeta isoform X2 n=1 Tax=Pectinophora gossypiella TaxID=13191 RepID=UPI00214EDD8A|nr:CCAAT/enhancer-binding protein zeta isoform X2 [Pectinophora gossypiella]
MKHKRFEENILVDEAYTNYGKVDKNADEKKGQGIAKHFAETLEFEERKKWYHQMPEEPSSITKTLTQEQIEELKKEANSALHGDTLAYETKQNRSGSSDHQWAKTLLNKGAIGDRVAAATILIQDNPLYNLTALRNLINSVKPAKKKDGIVIIDALSELLISDLLIPDTKLRTFEQHAVGHVDEMTSGNKQARRNILKLWHFEDQLKELYGSYVEALNKFAHDSVDANKEKAVSAMSYLLMHHPEREKMLLTNIINKLGDPTQAVGSKVIYHLCQLLYNHPNMKAVVLSEIEKMLFRSNISSRAQYYGICFLNQFFLGKDDSRIAENLIRIYFSFFKASIKKGDIDTRLMAAILTGVKRAYPFADAARLADTPAHVDAIHKLVHLAPMNTAIHALALLFQISAASKTTSDRYYTALYRKLTSADIFNTTHSALLFSLIYKSLKQDKDSRRVTSFVKRLLQLCCYMSPAQACGVLLLVSHVLREGGKKDAVRLVWTKMDVKEEVKEEPKVEETDDEETQATEVNGSLDSTAETKSTDDEVKTEQKKVDLLRGDKKDLLMEDDDEEAYVDLKIDEEGNVKPKKRRGAAAVPGWHHARVTTADKTEEKEQDTKIQLKKTINMDKEITQYNPLARNPSFAGAHCSAYLELLPLSQHFHPTVKLFAERLLSDQLIQYSGDPLKDFSGIRFLDRFVFKNPKKRTEREEDGEVKRVKGSHPKFAVRKNYMAKGLKSLPVNSASYLNEDAQKIPVDEKFLYDFLQKRREVNGSDDDDSDNDSVTSEDFEKYLDSVTGSREAAESDEELDYLAEMEATKQKRPKKTADDEDDENDDDDAADLSDEEDADGGSDGELNISGDEDEPQLSGDEDELLLEDSDDEEDQIDIPGKKNAKGKMKLKLKGTDDLGSLFASAEEFSTLLEETATNKKQGSSQAVANTDKASTKQLAWEENRDRWIKGFNKKILGNKSNKKGKNKKFSKPGNTSFNKMADKKKGGKRKSTNAGGPGGKKKKVK